MTRPAHMWPYWRDKKGTIPALRDYYPETLKTNARISAALAAIENAKVAIDAEFARLADIDPGDN